MIIVPKLNATAVAIAALLPCPFAGVVTADQIIAVMVEVGDMVSLSLVEAALAE